MSETQDTSGATGGAFAAYLGEDSAFDEAIATFASSYADTDEHDHARHCEAVDAGKIIATPGI
jgi:hypothetical protein